jgi:hypothetical protein
MTSFTYHHRNFLNQLRHGGWTSVAKLPDAPKIRVTLLQNGWIERRDTATGTQEYRITQTGLAAVSLPR